AAAGGGGGLGGGCPRRVVRTEAQDGPQLFDGLVVAARARQHGGEVHPGLDVVGLESERGSVVGARRFGAAEAGEQDRDVVVGVGVVGAQGEGRLVVGDRLL